MGSSAFAPDLAIGCARGVAVGLALGLVLLRSGDGQLARGRLAKAALGGLAALVFASHFNFFVWTGLHKHEIFHYYLGSKYFAELGHTELYRCALAAAAESEPQLADARFPVRDLRTNRLRPAATLLPRSERCDRSFTPARWRAFRSDVGWFRQSLGAPGFARRLRDHGYNPTPAWTLIGGALATRLPPTAPNLWLLARLDLLLLVLGFTALGWAFGFEAACLAVLVWGGNPHNRYEWIGDAFLRQLWFAAACAGIACLRRGLPAAAGGLLGLATALRLFPGLFALSYGLRELFGWCRRGRPRARLVRFTAAALAVTALLAAAGAVASGRPATAWQEFAENLETFQELMPLNGFGLEYLLAASAEAPDETVARRHPDRVLFVQRSTFESRRWLYWVGVAAFALLYVRALPRVRDWEAACLGAVWMVVLLMPAGYYLGLLAAPALVAARRPRLAAGLLAMLTLWNAATLAFGDEPLTYAVSSALGLAWLAWLLIELARTPSPSPAAHSGSSEGTR